MRVQPGRQQNLDVTQSEAQRPAHSPNEVARARAQTPTSPAAAETNTRAAPVQAPIRGAQNPRQRQALPQDSPIFRGRGLQPIKHLGRPIPGAKALLERYPPKELSAARIRDGIAARLWRLAAKDTIAGTHPANLPANVEGRIAEVPVTDMVPGQSRLSFEHVRTKLNKVAKRGFEKTPPAVLMPNGKAIVIDGNHNSAAAMFLGAEALPLDIVADLRDMSQQQAEAVVSQRGWVYPAKAGGIVQGVDALSDYGRVKDDPYRFLVSLAASKAVVDPKADPDADAVTLKRVNHIERKAWMKIDGVTANYTEFILADILVRAAQQDEDLRDKLEGPKDKKHLRKLMPEVRETLLHAAESGAFDPDSLRIVLFDNDFVEEDDDDVSASLEQQARTLSTQAAPATGATDAAQS